MKKLPVFLLLLLASMHVFSQKNLTVQSANLNMSKSNINRVIYGPGLITSTNAQLLLDELDKTPMDEAQLKMWVAANFKRFGVDSALVKQTFVYSFRQYADCKVCTQHCKGRCVQDPGSDCICYFHSEPNLRIVQSERPGKIILLSPEAPREGSDLDLLTVSISRATSVKSGKSNSSD
jgi:hypothetical protein